MQYIHAYVFNSDRSPVTAAPIEFEIRGLLGWERINEYTDSYGHAILCLNGIYEDSRTHNINIAGHILGPYHLDEEKWIAILPESLFGRLTSYFGFIAKLLRACLRRVSITPLRS